MESSPADPSRANEAPSVSSSLGETGPGEIALTFEGEGPAVSLSRVDALRLAARLRQVAEANRSLDRKLAALQQRLGQAS